MLGNELDRTEGTIRQSIINLQNELRSLERRENANTNAETQLLLDSLDPFELVCPEVGKRSG